MKYLISILLLIITATNSQAQSIRGGEITWECITSGSNLGKYILYLDLYYDCASTAPGTSQSIEVENSSFSAISLTQTSDEDISIGCYNASSTISCANSSPQAVSRKRYASSPVTLNGIPPASGWVFTWSNCCRPATDNLSPGQGITLRSVIYPFKNKNANPCFDSSPILSALPIPYFSAEYKMTYGHTAEDLDQDEVLTTFASPLDDYTSWPASGVSYQSSYSSTQPFPGTSKNPGNQPANLNSILGSVELLSFTTGKYTTAVEVESYKEGVKVASVYREFTHEIVPKSTLPPPFPPNTVNKPPSASLSYKFGPPVAFLIDTFLPGDTVKFDINAIDFDFLPGFIQQSVRLEAIGEQFGSGFSNSSSGCPYPPCATLKTDAISGYNAADNNWKKVSQLSNEFYWVIDPVHSSSALTTYNFQFQFFDDNCAHPGIGSLNASISVIGTPASISGNVFEDANGNGLKESGESSVANKIIKVDPIGRYYSTDSAGNYDIRLPYGSYQLSLVGKPYSVQTTLPTTYSVSLTPANRVITNQEFGFQNLVGVNDGRITITGYGTYRPGNSIPFDLTYKNRGTTTLSGDVEFTFSNLLSFISSNPSPSGISGNTLSWNYSNLSPNSSKSIQLMLSLDSSAKINDTVLCFATMKPVLNDTTPDNNMDTLFNTVINSYDPNSKSVYPAGDVTPLAVQKGHDLEYTINFQNLGNAPAIDVVLRDTISEDLIIESFEMLSASHAYTYEIFENELIWTFEDINLPDSASDEAHSHGFVKFEIMADKSLQLNDSALNRAAIYFDLNIPIITNYAITRIKEPVGLKTISENSGFKIYPNPNNGEFSIEFEGSVDGITEIILHDIRGKIVLKSKIAENSGESIKIKDGHLKPGLYLITINQADGKIKRGKVLIDN